MAKVSSWWTSQTVESAEIESPLSAVVEACTVAVPHSKIWVPQNFVPPMRVTSGSGAYYYQGDKNHFCTRFVVDVMMATYSATGSTTPEAPPQSGEVWIFADAYDLPSSSAFGGTIPTTQEDCGRFTLYISVYKKLASETEFTKVNEETIKASWASGKCERAFFQNVGVAKKSQTGWDTYRGTVACVLRSSAQEVQVYLDWPPPA